MLSIHLRYSTIGRAISRCCLFALFFMAGLLAIAPGPRPSQHMADSVTEAQSVQVIKPQHGSGLGAGGITLSPTGAQHTTIPNGCGLTDVTCWVEQAINAILTSVANTVQVFEQGIVGGITKSMTSQHDTNFITQTPLCFSSLFGCDPTQPLDATLQAFTGWAQGVAAAALAFIVLVGGFNLMLGRQMGVNLHGLSEFIPRVILVFLAATVSPMIVQAFIDLNNALCQGVLTILGLAVFANLLNALIAIALGDGWLVFLFLMVMGAMALLLTGQMLFRLAFAAFLGALAPIGFLCFALPQTMGWGRLWLRNFSLTVFVQFLQVAMLSIGGSMLANIVALANPLFGGLQNANIILEIILSTVLLYLTFRLPGMLQTWAMRALADQVGQATIDTVIGVGEFVAEVAPELLALL